MNNYLNKTPPWENGEVVDRGLFVQMKPTLVLQTGLVINGGNCTNLIFPVDTEINGGLHMQVDFCAHEHPEWDLPEEGLITETCRHVTDVIEFPDKTIYKRQDTVLSTGPTYG